MKSTASLPPPAADQAPGPGNDQGHGTGPGDTRPYLCIPYWETPRLPSNSVDIGQLRPLPSDIISWECPGIQPTPYIPGEPLQVTVDVRNSGPGSATALATVLVYWADPTVGFAHPTLFGVGSVAAPPMRNPSVSGFVSTTIIGTIPAAAPAHVCLLACVTHSLDLAPTILDPIGDRHWAQHNIIAVSTKISPIIFTFTVANAFRREDQFQLVVRPLARQVLDLFALRHKFEPAVNHARLHLADPFSRPVTEADTEVHTTLALPAGSSRRYSLAIELERPLGPHELAVFEILLLGSRNDQHPAGSLGIVIRGD
jgi:hypothetical protein